MPYQVLCSTFCVIVVVSNIISAKMFSLPFFPHLILPAGLITYPFTFLLSDLVTEIYGAKKAKQMVYIAFGTCLISYCIIQTALALPSGPSDAHQAFQATLGLNGLLLFSSLAAYLVSQIVDIQLYAFIKQRTGPRFLWLRNNGSTLASQVVDTLIVNILHLHWGLGMEMRQVIPILILAYAYKASFSIANTPLFYLFVFFIKKYRGDNSLQKNGARLYG